MTMRFYIVLSCMLLVPGLATAQDAPPPQAAETESAETGAAETGTAETEAGTAPSAVAETEAVPSGPTRIAVPNMVAKESDAELATMLTDIIAVEARKVDGFEVIGMSDIEAALGYEQKKMLVGCDDVSCMAEIGGALGVRIILASKVGRVGDTYVLTMRLIDTQDVKVVASTYDTVEGKPDALIAKIRNTVPGLMLQLRGQQTVASGSTEATGSVSKSDGGIVLNWAALGATGFGMAALMASGVLGVLSLGSFNDYDTEAEDVVVNDLTFFPRNSQTAIQGGQVMGSLCLGTLGIGVAATVGGIVWQMMSQNQEAE